MAVRNDSMADSALPHVLVIECVLVVMHHLDSNNPDWFHSSRHNQGPTKKTFRSDASWRRCSCSAPSGGAHVESERDWADHEGGCPKPLVLGIDDCAGLGGRSH